MDVSGGVTSIEPSIKAVREFVGEQRIPTAKDSV